MSRCPSCGQETRRTTDWACRWCGYPLASGSYKKIDESYRTRLAERGPRPAPAPPEPEPTPTPETAPTEPEALVAGEPEPPAPETTTPPETEPKPAAKKPKRVSKKPKTPPEPAPPPELTGSVIAVTVEQLIADYQANAVAADDKYQGQTLQLTGMVDSVDKDMLDNPFVKLSSADRNEMLRIRCTFPQEHEERLLQLTAGQQVTVRGSYDGYLVNILLKDCVLVEE